MADSIQTKKSSQDALRLSQQQQAEKKRQLMAQQKEDLKAMKQYYADKNQELDNESAAAVNHISGNKDAAAQDGAQKTSSSSIPSIYNRSARSVASAKEALSEESVKKAQPKSNDDFYKVQDRGSKMHNESDKYIIEAYAPENEQNNLRVSVQSNKAVISGQRKHTAEAEHDGKKLSTNNFQTFREEFKFDKPVSHEGMTRERVGDFIRFSIPKLEALHNDSEES